MSRGHQAVSIISAGFLWPQLIWTPHLQSNHNVRHELSEVRLRRIPEKKLYHTSRCASMRLTVAISTAVQQVISCLNLAVMTFQWQTSRHLSHQQRLAKF